MRDATVSHDAQILVAPPGATYRFHVAIIQGKRSEYPDPRTLAHDPRECLLRAKKLNPVFSVVRVMEVGVTLLWEVPV